MNQLAQDRCPLGVAAIRADAIRRQPVVAKAANPFGVGAAQYVDDVLDAEALSYPEDARQRLLRLNRGIEALWWIGADVAVSTVVAEIGEVRDLVALAASVAALAIGLLIGGVVPFIFAADTMKAVGRAAFHVVEEVRREHQGVRLPGAFGLQPRHEVGGKERRVGGHRNDLRRPQVGSGIQAGQNAGMATVAAAYGYIAPGDDPRNWGADLIAADTAELTQILLKAVNLGA